MEDLSKSAFEAEAIVDAEQGSKSGKRNEFCLNCGAKLTDIYCQHCGQKDIPRRQTMGDMLSNFISSFFNYEGKFLKTNRDLILKPGFLAMEYNAGRRESYFHPVRMYFFISFVFFLLFFSLPEEEKTKKVVSKGDAELTDDDIKELGVKSGNPDSLMKALSKNPSINKFVPGLTDTLKKYAKDSVRTKKRYSGFSLQESKYASVAEYDSEQLALPEKDRDGWAERRLTRRSIELTQKYKGDKSKFGADYSNAFKENFSKVLFYLLPFFALLLKLLYVRRDYYFSEHLVFSIYYYNFFYFAGCIIMLLNLLPYTGWLVFLISTWVYLYLLFAMKRTYQQGWGKTIAKFFLFSFGFFWLSVIAFAALAFVLVLIL